MGVLCAALYFYRQDMILAVVVLLPLYVVAVGRATLGGKQQPCRERPQQRLERRRQQRLPAGQHAAGDHPHDQGMNKAGKPGVAANVVRAIHITMSDKNRFTPSSVKVNQGETIRFVVKNAGKKKHEMVIGSVDDIKAHHELMARFPGMAHDEPNMVDLQSGEKGEIIWQFTELGQFQFACLVTGHFEAGMKGVINVVMASTKAKPQAQTPTDHSKHQH